jgi:hypothetical protein
MEGRNLRIDLRFAESDPGRYSSLARALVALQPHAVIAYSTPIAATFFWTRYRPRLRRRSAAASLQPRQCGIQGGTFGLCREDPGGRNRLKSAD